MDDLNCRIERALELRRRDGKHRLVVTGIPQEVMDVLDAIAADAGIHNRSEIGWKAIHLYLSAYRNTRKGFLPRFEGR